MEFMEVNSDLLEGSLKPQLKPSMGAFKVEGLERMFSDLEWGSIGQY